MIWIYILFVAGLVNFFIAMAGINRFLANHASIGTQECLEEFKKLARCQMYQALIQLLFIAPMGVISVVGIIIGKLNAIEFIIVLALNFVNIFLGMYGKRFEEKARRLPVEGEELGREYIQICEDWVKKPLPKF